MRGGRGPRPGLRRQERRRPVSLSTPNSAAKSPGASIRRGGKGHASRGRPPITRPSGRTRSSRLPKKRALRRRAAEAAASMQQANTALAAHDQRRRHEQERRDHLGRSRRGPSAGARANAGNAQSGAPTSTPRSSVGKRRRSGARRPDAPLNGGPRPGARVQHRTALSPGRRPRSRVWNLDASLIQPKEVAGGRREQMRASGL